MAPAAHHGHHAGVVATSIIGLWREGMLCDCVVATDDGQTLPCHRVVLAAGASYFCAAFLGAGSCMHGTWRGADGAAVTTPPSAHVVLVPETDMAHVRHVITALYEGHVDVNSHNLEPLLRTASFLGAGLVLDACTAFMREAVCLDNIVPLLILASRYNLSLKTELVSFVCGKFSTLCAGLPSADGAGGHTPYPPSSSGSDAQPARDQHSAQPSSSARLHHQPDTLSSLGTRSIQHEASTRSSNVNGTPHTPADSFARFVVGSWPRSSASTGVWPAWITQSANRQQPTSPRLRASSSTDLGEAGGLDSRVQPSGPTPTGPLPAPRRAVSPLAALPKDLLLELLHSDELSVECELDVLHVVVDWVAADPPTRSHALPELLAAVRAEHIPAPLALPLLTPSELCESGASTPDGTGAVLDVVEAARVALRGAGRPGRRALPTGLVAAGGHDATWRSLKTTETYDPTTDTWLPGPGMPQGLSFAAAGLVDREVVVVGGSPLWSCVNRLSSGGAWQPGPGLSVPRAHAGVVACANTLFVLGGRSQVQTVQHVLPSVEVLSEDGSAWRTAPDMTTPRTALAAAAVRGVVYALGGQTAKQTLRTCEWYDSGAERWVPLTGRALLTHELKYASAVSLGGRIYLVGGMNEARHRTAGVAAFDPREGRWQDLAPMTCPRSSAGVAALQVGPHGRLYAVGGSAPGDHVHHTVELYVPEMNAWLPAAPLGCGRSGLALCAA